MTRNKFCCQLSVLICLLILFVSIIMWKYSVSDSTHRWRRQCLTRLQVLQKANKILDAKGYPIWDYQFPRRSPTNQ